MPRYSFKCVTEDCKAFDIEIKQECTMTEIMDVWFECGLCAQKLQRIYRAPYIKKFGWAGSDSEIKAMRKDFDRRFVRGAEIDEVRHKHGEAFDDSLRSAAVKRFKDGKGPRGAGGD